MIRISEHQLHHLMARLSQRAMTVLRFLAQQRFATTSHLARLLRPHHARSLPYTKAAKLWTNSKQAKQVWSSWNKLCST